MTARTIERSACLVCLVSVLLGACQDTGTRRGDGWSWGKDTASTRDTSLPSDTSASDSSSHCADFMADESCTGQPGCTWWWNSCEEDNVGRCIPDGQTPERLACETARCASLESEDVCDVAGGCEWDSRTCSDGREETVCRRMTEPTPVLCPDDGKSCAERAPERCEPGECELYEPGCGTNPGEYKEPTCLSPAHCEEDEDCDAGEACAIISVRPTCDDCDACGAGVPKCVPESWVDEPKRCPELGRIPCQQSDKCEMMWPACNDEAPDGAETFDEPSCRWSRSCSGNDDCFPSFECKTVWTGCPPDESCEMCGVEKKRCLPAN